MTQVREFNVCDPDLLTHKNVIEASAGTGKTFSIAILFLRLILEKNFQIHHILAVTFTNAGADEMKSRVPVYLRLARELLKSGNPPADTDVQGQLLWRILTQALTHATPDQLMLRLELALMSMDQVQIYTIHGFCKNIVTQFAFDCAARFDLDLTTDEDALLYRAMADYFRMHFQMLPPIAARYVLDQDITPDTLVTPLARTLSNPFVCLRPENPEPVTRDDLERCSAELVGLSEQLAAMYSRETGAVNAAIQTIRIGSERIHARRNAEAIEELVRFFRMPEPELFSISDLDAVPEKALTGWYHRLRAGVITAQPNAAAPGLLFFEVWDQYVRQCAFFNQRMAAYTLYHQCGARAFARNWLAEAKAAANQMTFNDLIMIVFQALQSNRRSALIQSVQAACKAVLIDEFQDTDSVQYAIFKALFFDSACAVYLIGDPKQAIYSFRGADIFAYLMARSDPEIPDNRRFTMTRNFRSTPSLVRGIAALFSIQEQPFLHPDIQFTAVEGQSSLTFVDGEAAPPPLVLWVWPETLTNVRKARELFSRAVVHEIAGLVCPRSPHGLVDSTGEKRPVNPGDIAVLCRNSLEIKRLKTLLDRAGIPNVTAKSDSIVESEEAHLFLQFIMAVLEPARTDLLRGVLLSGLFALPVEAVKALAEQELEWEAWLNRFARYHALWLTRGLMVMWHTFTAENQVRARILAFPNGERRLTNADHLAEVLDARARTANLGLSGTVALLESWIRDPGAIEEADALKLRMDTDADAVKLMTIHASKGLQFPIVFCPFLWNDRALNAAFVTYQDPENRDRKILDLAPGPDALAHAEQEKRQESIRLAYVALTRAQSRLYVGYGFYLYSKAEVMDALTLLLFGITDKHAFLAAQHTVPYDQLYALAAQNPDLLQTCELPLSRPVRLQRASQAPDALSIRTLTRPMPEGWQIQSFTALANEVSEEADRELPDYDAPASPQEDLGAAQPAAGIFALEKGARIGVMLHSLFENLDFTAADFTPRIREILARYRFSPEGPDQTDWIRVLNTTVRQVVNAPLWYDPAFSLSQIPPADTLSEMAFYYPVDAAHIHHLMAAEGRDLSLSHRQLAGFMKGYIDLVCRVGEQYFIVDWKSNHLGNSPESYAGAAMAAAMASHQYHLQYRIYTVALVSYLQNRIPAFDYDRHFGGIIYVFLRGVDAAGVNGLFRIRPSLEQIQPLLGYLPKNHSRL